MYLTRQSSDIQNWCSSKVFWNFNWKKTETLKEYIIETKCGHTGIKVGHKWAKTGPGICGIGWDEVVEIEQECFENYSIIIIIAQLKSRSLRIVQSINYQSHPQLPKMLERAAFTRTSKSRASLQISLSLSGLWPPDPIPTSIECFWRRWN